MRVLFSLLAVLFVGANAQTCPDGFDLVGDRCLFFEYQTNYTYDDARTYCQGLGGDLAIVDDCHLLGEIARFIDEMQFPSGEGFWIGANDIDEEGSFVWLDGTPVTLGAPYWGRWPDLPPEPQEDGDHCASMDADDGFYFHNTHCEIDEGYYPLCQTAPGLGDSCIAPYLPIGGSCFNFLDTAGTWETARDMCEMDGGNLAVIHDCNLLGDVATYIADSGIMPERGFWIGGYRFNNWYWLDETPMPMGVPFWGQEHNNYTQLQPNSGFGQTEEDCVDLWTKDRYYFDDYVCSVPMPALCEVPAQ